ncbi:MAG TPA: protein translocase subunit SecD, partial [Candidatus Binataceae bacterium]|nr:protein translocase subunit SecD [Candidatus Binataceae bacterium]
METATQNPIPIVVLLTLGVVFLYLHFTNGSGALRLALAGALVLAAVALLLPSFRLPLLESISSLDNLPKIQLGLDLQGGTHLLLEVKLDDAVATALRRRGDDLKRELKDNKLDADITQAKDGSLLVTPTVATTRSQFLDLVGKSFSDLVVSTAENATGAAFSLNYRLNEATQVRTNAMDQALETIRNRIDQLGVRETTVVKEGDNNILVQLPGIQDPERAKDLIGKTAVLEFKMVDDKHPLADALRDGPPPGDEILEGPAQAGGPAKYLIETPVLMTGDVVTDARVRVGSRLEGPYVQVTLDRRGTAIFGAITAENVGREIAIVLDNTVYSAPVIKEPIPGGDVQITGNFTFEEAHELAIVLRSGALPAPVEIIEERTVGPSLGRDSIRQGELSFVVGALAVLAFMAIYYSGAGILADLGLALNILLLVCVMAALQATLTLPGIAGIVLTLGMSVDANVLV